MKTVFPNYEYSNVYDDKLYKNINGVNLQKSPSAIVQTPIEVKPYEHEEFLTTDASETRLNIENFDSSIKKDNLHFYNIPNTTYLGTSMTKEPDHVSKFQKEQVGKVEGFSETIVDSGNNISHEQYIKHLSECSVCKEMVLKQFNIETERLRNEEVIELISYIMFGLFILILIDNLKK